MGWSLTLTRVRGIEIKVHATFVLILIWAAYYWGADTDAGTRGIAFGVVATLLLFVCVTLHELGHAVVAQHYGIEVRDITLLPIGGVARLDVPENPKQELWIALAGPAVNVVIAVVLVAVAAVLQATSLVTPGNLVDSIRNAEWDGLLPYLVATNLYLVAFNAIPAFPLDGGRVLRALLALRMDYRRATRIAVSVGQGLALFFGLAGFATGDYFLILIAIFVWFGASGEGQQVAVDNVLGGATVGQVMIRQPQRLYPTDPLSRAVGLTLSTAQADFPVVDGNERVVGLLTMDDLVRGLHESAGSAVGMVMHRNYPTARPDETILAVQARLAESRLRALPIVAADGTLAGFLTAGDIGEAFRILSVRPQMIGRQPVAGSR
ncbi:MAG TPA: site-2 protease family protein [Thermomicrobiales bacterium]|jgi:stage IV sporulation protein FB